jgi:hypothetical protein
LLPDTVLRGMIAVADVGKHPDQAALTIRAKTAIPAGLQMCEFPSVGHLYTLN